MPGYRGRLIFGFKASIRRLDATSTAEADSGNGYDSDYREPERVPAAGQQAGASTRAEYAAVLLPVQVEPTSFESLRLMLTGQAPDVAFQVVAHFADLEAAGLVERATKLPKFRFGDRLEAIYEKDGTTLAQTIPTPLYLVDVRPIGFGFSTHRNLLLLTFNEREASVTR